MTALRTALVAGTTLAAAATVTWLLLAEVGRVEGPGDAAAIRDAVSVEGYDRVATPPDAAVFAGPPGGAPPADRLSGPGAPWVHGGTAVGLPEELRAGLDPVVSGLAEDDCTVQVARFHPDRLPRELLRSWSVPPSEVDATATGNRVLLYAWVVCGGG